MKSKNYIFAGIAWLFAQSLSAQIQLSSDDIYAVGNFKMAQDNTGAYNIGTPGPNKTWDFTGLKKQILYQFSLLPYKGYGKGNNANMVKVDAGDTFEYIAKSSNAITQYLPIQDLSEVDFYSLKFLQVPLKYNDGMQDSFGFVHYYSALDVGIDGVDSIKVTYKMGLSTLADAWGQIKLPNGNLNALRVKTVNRNFLRVDGKSGSGAYTQMHQYDQDDATTEYNWYAQGKGSPVANYSVSDSSMSYMLSTTADVENIRKPQPSVVYTNPFADGLLVKNTGSNSYDICIFDTNGKLVAQQQLSAESVAKLDSRDWPGGLYVLRVFDPTTNQVSNYKLLK